VTGRTLRLLIIKPLTCAGLIVAVWLLAAPIRAADDDDEDEVGHISQSPALIGSYLHSVSVPFSGSGPSDPCDLLSSIPQSEYREAWLAREHVR